MKDKIIQLLLLFGLVMISLTACGGNDPANTETPLPLTSTSIPSTESTDSSTDELMPEMDSEAGETAQSEQQANANSVAEIAATEVEAQEAQEAQEVTTEGSPEVEAEKAQEATTEGEGSSDAAAEMAEEIEGPDSDETQSNNVEPDASQEPTAVAESDESEHSNLIDETNATSIMLNDAATTITGDGATVNGSTVTISSAGTYILSGTLNDGQVMVDSKDDAPVYLVLDGVTLNNSSTAPLFVSNASEVIIDLKAGSENVVTDGASYIFEDETIDEPNAAIFSKDELTITGSGSLTVNGNYNDGLASKDGLFITSGTLIVSAIDDGIRGKDYVIVRGGELTVNAEDEGIKADNEDDVSLGYIHIEDGTLNLTTGGKGLNGTNLLTVDGGTITANSTDDALHSNDSIIINGGNIMLATGDDGIHADNTVTVNGGTIDITQSYEGIESTLITINDGAITLISSDDGFNATDGSAEGGRGGPPPGPGQEATSYDGNIYLIINGGTLVVDAGGDGVDSNGAIEMHDGLLIVNGPTERNNGALDYNGIFTMTGGFFVATGSSGMAEAPSTISTQNSLLVNFDEILPAGTLVHIESADGRELLTFAPTKEYQSVAFSSPDLVPGETVTVSVGGTISGEAFAGLYQVDGYQDGTPFIELTLDSSVTTYGERGPGPGGPPGGPGGGPGGPGRRPDFAAAAAQLGVTEEALMAALGEGEGEGERRGPPDFAAAAATLGITEAELMTALGIGERPPGEEPPMP